MCPLSRSTKRVTERQGKSSIPRIRAEECRTPFRAVLVGVPSAKDLNHQRVATIWKHGASTSTSTIKPVFAASRTCPPNVISISAEFPRWGTRICIELEALLLRLLVSW